MEQQKNTQQIESVNLITKYLEDIFLKSNCDKLTKLIKNTSAISSLLNFIYLTSKTVEKIQLINYLTFNFRLFPQNIEIFSRHFIELSNGETYSIFHILIDLFLRESISIDGTEEDLELLDTTIKECMEEIINNVDCTKSIFEFVFQKMAKYYRDEGGAPLTKVLFMKYLSILKILFGEKLTCPKPKNYFYFSGAGGINVDEFTLHENKLKLSYGCAISIWFKIDIEPEELEEMNPRHKSHLITLDLASSKQSVRISLVESNKLIISNYSEKDFVRLLPTKEWIHLSLVIKPKSFMRSPEFLLFINNENPNKFGIPSFNCDCEVSHMTFFSNFIGQASSIMFMNKAIPEEYVKLLGSYPEGLYNDSKVYNFMKNSNDKYMSQSNTPHCSKFIPQKNIEGPAALTEHLKFLYTPYQCSRIIEDVCGNYNAGFEKQGDLSGVHTYHCYMKNIYLVGGINNLLPIAELLHSSVQLIQNYQLLTPILDTDTFYSYLETISIILSYRKKNMTDALNKNFFQILSLFIEKFPKEIFNEKVLEALLTIARSLFTLVDHCLLSCTFFDHILLNEKIFSKFNITIQSQLWNSLYQFYVSDISQVKSFMHMSKICLVLRYYDEKRFLEYCCKDHANIFSHNLNSIPVMNPEMKSKIQNLIQIIQFIIDNSDPDKSDDAVTLFKLLSLDLSPCLQKFILAIFLNFFSNPKISNEKKYSTLAKLMGNYFIDVSMYIMSISLLDVRCDIVKLYSYISNSHPSLANLMKNNPLYEDKVIPLIKEFVLPCNLLTKKLLESRKKSSLCKSEEKVKRNSLPGIAIDQEEITQVRMPLSSKYAMKGAFKFDKDTTEKLIVVDTNQVLEKPQPLDTPEYLQIADTTAQDDNSYDVPEIQPFKIAKSDQAPADTVPQSLDNATSIFKKPHLSKNKLVAGSGCKGFSNIRRSHQSGRTPNAEMKIDIETINNDMLGKEDEDSKELEKKIQLLAKHCVDYINGNATKDECNNPEFMLITNPHYKCLTKSASLRVDLDREWDLDEGKVPRTGKAAIKSTFSYEKYSVKEVIEEDSNDISSSPFKRRDSQKEATVEGLQEDILKLQLSGEKPKSEKLLNMEEDYLISGNTKLRDSVTESILFIPNNVESLISHIDPDIYNSQLENMYTILFLWMIKKKDMASPSYSTLLVDDNDFICNPQIIDILTMLAQNSDMIYILKLLQDLHLLLMNNNDNCFVLYKNQNFYHWLVETMFKGFQMRNDDFPCVMTTKKLENRANIAMSIFDLGKKIHTELIINTIYKEEKLRNEPVNRISYLLTWGMYYKSLYDYNRSYSYEVNDFLRALFRDILASFKDKCAMSSPNITFSLWENFVSFTALCYEFVTFYNLDKTMKVNSIALLEPNCDSIIVPTCLFSGLNLDRTIPPSQEKKKECITKLWIDYRMCDDIIRSFSKIWNFQSIIKLTQIGSSQNMAVNSNLIIKFEKLVEEFVVNKKRKDLFYDDLKILFYNSETLPPSYDLHLIKVLSNLFTITITLIQDETEAKVWIDEYLQFLLYVILASTNMTTTGSEFYNTVQDVCIDVIAFGLCFLNDEYFNSKKNISFTKSYADALKSIFIFISLILEYAHKQFEKNKKKINIISNLLKKSRKHDLTKCAVYRVFSEFVLDKNGNQLLTARSINEMKLSQYVDLPFLFSKDGWKQGLTENPLLKNKLKKLFDFNTYEYICRERYEAIKKIVPAYDNTLITLEIGSFSVNTNIAVSPIVNSTSMINHKASVNKVIENLIPFYELEIKKYSNSSFLGQKYKRNTYKLAKKKLFSWRGMWSDRDLFFNHTEKLKLKMLNHYTSQLARPLLIPILDVNYYVPQFTHYKIDLLFNKNDKNVAYKFNLDIDDILKSIDNTDTSKTSSDNDNPLSTNYFKDIYEFTHPTIWKYYSQISSQLDFSRDAGFIDILNKFRVTSTDPNLKQFENFYECCFVKPSHHIKGIFYINKNGITFRVFLNQIKGNNLIETNNSKRCDNNSKTISASDQFTSFEVITRDDDFDLDRNTCFGSYFVSHHKDKDTLTFDFPYNEIKYIFKRRYYYRKSAIEMFSCENKSYYFNFKTSASRENVIKEILAHLEVKRDIRIDTKDKEKEENLIVGYENLSCVYSSLTAKKSTKSEYLSSKIDAWANWRMSNFELLMWLNTFANRSYSDLSQYPVFPWILSNYTGNKIDISTDLRNFCLPMGMMDLDERGEERKNLYIDTFTTLKAENEENSAPYFYGSHYSNPMYVSHYLTRLFPFAHIMIELQGDKFDDPNRLFISIANSFDCAATQKGDVRELIPEFFYLPEMFMNINNLNLGISTDMSMRKKLVNNVNLPEWADDNPYDFVIKMREYLESEEVNQSINNWIDLVFGYKQKGKEAELAYNLFIPSSYEDVINIDVIEKDQRPYYLRMVEFGLTPNNLITREFLIKYKKDHIRRGKQVTESSELKYYSNNQNKPKTALKPLMLKLKVLDNDKVMCVYNNNTYNLYKFTPSNSDSKFNMDSVSRIYITSDNVFKLTGKIQEYYSQWFANPPVVIYNGGKIIAQGGFWDGRISICYQEGTITRLYNLFTELDNNPVIVLAMDKEEKLAFSGTTIGTVNIFRVYDHKWEFVTSIDNHIGEITSISISNSLNMWASSGLDGYVNLYTMPSNRQVRSIKMKDKLTADYVFLSSSPLPSFVVYSKLAQKFFSYSINGFFLCEVIDDCVHIMSPIVFTDISFCDFLLYGTPSGMFRIRKFPNMTLHYELILAENRPIKCLDITEDKKFCYVWTMDGQDIILIKDPSVTSETAAMNLIHMGFAAY